MNTNTGMRGLSMNTGTSTMNITSIDMGKSLIATHIHTSGCSTVTSTIRTFIIAMDTRGMPEAQRKEPSWL